MTDSEMNSPNEFKNTAVRMCEFSAGRSFINKFHFNNCTIVGPAVLVLVDKFMFLGGTFQGNSDELFWTTR